MAEIKYMPISIVWTEKNVWVHSIIYIEVLYTKIMFNDCTWEFYYSFSRILHSVG